MGMDWNIYSPMSNVCGSVRIHTLLNDACDASENYVTGGSASDSGCRLIGTNAFADLLPTERLRTNFNDISIKIQTFHCRKCFWKCLLQNGGRLSCPQIVKLSEISVVTCWNQNGYGLGQWETTLHCNVVSHWLSQYSERSLRVIAWQFFLLYLSFSRSLSSVWCQAIFLTNAD